MGLGMTIRCECGQRASYVSDGDKQHTVVGFPERRACCVDKFKRAKAEILVAYPEATVELVIENESS